MLRLVVVELRYNPVLRIDNDVAGFQDKIRAKFPSYDVADEQTLDITRSAVGLLPQLKVRVERRHTFANEQFTVSLTRNALRIDTKRHSNHIDLAAVVADSGEALESEYGVSCTRLGIRYVNHVDPGIIGSKLGREVTVHDLIKSDFLGAPYSDLGEAQFSYELNDTFPDREGAMTVRWGLLRGTNGGLFVLDIDRYVENPSGTSTLSHDVEKLTGDIFSVFMSAASDTLIEYLEIE